MLDNFAIFDLITLVKSVPSILFQTIIYSVDYRICLVHVGEIWATQLPEWHLYGSIFKTSAENLDYALFHRQRNILILRLKKQYNWTILAVIMSYVSYHVNHVNLHWSGVRILDTRQGEVAFAGRLGVPCKWWDPCFPERTRPGIWIWTTAHDPQVSFQDVITPYLEVLPTQ